ncbi:MAG: hypothetical protein C0394_03600 [Syntrophus sp. (in: bacteria)]|nr:hypothetical protein [Syntrophus sp. (in: bacteria)]
MPVCRSHRGARLGKLKAHPRGLVGRWIVILLVCFLFPACSGQPLTSIKTYQAKGVYHRVKSGETLYLIARAYNVNMQELAEANNIQDPGRIEAGSVLFVPDARQAIDDIISSMDKKRPATGAVLPEAAQPAVKQAREGVRAPVKPPPVREETIPPRTEVLSGAPTIRIKPGKVLERIPDVSREAGKSTPPGPEKEPTVQPAGHASIPVQKLERMSEGQTATQSVAAGEATGGRELPVEPPPSKTDADSIQFDRKRFVWPAKGKVVSRFGIQPNGMYYNGITIAAGEDAPVFAAARGTVIFSGTLKDYGETIIIQHEDHYATVYTRLGQREVKIEDRVKQASIVGRLGKGGAARFNFEIRYHTKARNPMFFLP